MYFFSYNIIFTLPCLKKGEVGSVKKILNRKKQDFSQICRLKEKTQKGNKLMKAMGKQEWSYTNIKNISTFRKVDGPDLEASAFVSPLSSTTKIKSYWLMRYENISPTLLSTKLNRCRPLIFFTMIR